MISHEMELRVRYNEVDRMGFLYHSHYVEYYDMGRNELIRSLGITQLELEKVDNVMIPVIDLKLQYISSANFDDILVVKTYISELPRVKALFHAEIYRDGVMINKMEVTLAFIDARTKKATRPPKKLMDAFAPYFNH